MAGHGPILTLIHNMEALAKNLTCLRSPGLNRLIFQSNQIISSKTIVFFSTGPMSRISEKFDILNANADAIMKLLSFNVDMFIGGQFGTTTDRVIGQFYIYDFDINPT